MDQHKYLSPQKNRALGNKNVVADERIQSHHAIQDKWAEKNIPNYKRDEAPAILLPTGKGRTHTNISKSQNARRVEAGFNTPIREEFNISYREMIDAGIGKKEARKAIKDSYKYFDSLKAFN